MQKALLFLAWLASASFASAQTIENVGSLTDLSSSSRRDLPQAVESAVMENGYDFNGTVRIPGFGPLSADEIQGALEHHLRALPR